MTAFFFEKAETILFSEIAEIKSNQQLGDIENCPIYFAIRSANNLKFRWSKSSVGFCPASTTTELLHSSGKQSNFLFR